MTDYSIAAIRDALRTDDGPGIVWTPFPGPQTVALASPADVLLYGGAAGGGKTQMLIGLALTQHQRAIIFRREYPQLREIIEKTRELAMPAGGSFNENNNLWRLPGGRLLEFGAVSDESAVQRFQGRAHDLKGFDEITHFSETQFRFLITWARTTRRQQRVRVVATGNPPIGAEGEWVLHYWAPWVDDQHPHPAGPGELRWFVRADGEDREVEGPAPLPWKGEALIPTSRTFIPARLTDNPALMATNYLATLQALPEEMRVAFLHGDWRAGRQDDPMQVIPRRDLRAAVDRWSERPPRVPITQIGIDVARGGSDRTVIMWRHGWWFARPLVIPGRDTPDGASIAGPVLELIDRFGDEQTRVAIDVGGGYGGSPLDILRQVLGDRVYGVNPSVRHEHARDRSGLLGFLNQRSRYWWTMREVLDQMYGQPVALPPHADLLRELAIPKWELRQGGIVKVEGRDELVKRLGASPDIATACVLTAYPAHTVDRSSHANVTYIGAGTSSSQKEETIDGFFGVRSPRVS